MKKQTADFLVGTNILSKNKYLDMFIKSSFKQIYIIYYNIEQISTCSVY